MIAEELKEFILEEAEKGNIVYQDSEGLHGISIKDFVKQPLEGQLYDLNRGREVILTFISQPKWVNDYAMMLLVEYYHSKLAEIIGLIDEIRTKATKEYKKDIERLKADGEYELKPQYEAEYLGYLLALTELKKGVGMTEKKEFEDIDLMLESYSTAMHLGHIVLASKNKQALHQFFESKLKDARVDEQKRNIDMFLYLPDSEFTDLQIQSILLNRIKELEKLQVFSL